MRVARVLMRWSAQIAVALFLASSAAAAPAGYERSDEMRVATDAMDRGDMAAAVSGFQRAAQKGDTGALMLLGSLYEWGQGVPRDYVLARKYLRAAANGGWGEAMNNLGVMLWKGDGGHPDHVEGFKWLLLSVRNMAERHDEASTPISTPKENLDKYRSQMTAAEIAEAEHRASAWRPEKTR